MRVRTELSLSVISIAHTLSYSVDNSGCCHSTGGLTAKFFNNSGFCCRLLPIMRTMALRPPERSVAVCGVLAALSDESSYEQLSQLVGPGYSVVRCEPLAPEETAKPFVERLVEQCDEQVAAVFVEASLGGAQLLAELALARPNVRRVLITRGDDPPGLEEALERAEIDYVVRPPLARLHVAKAVHMLLESFDRARASRSILRSLRRVSATRGEPAALAELYRASDVLDSVHRRESSPSSGLYGNHAFMQRLREEVARARRYKKNLTLLHLDVDEFGIFNQAHGWEGGNEALARVIHAISPPRGVDETDERHGEGYGEGCVRTCDIVGRLGGQSFAVLLPETNRKGGQTIAERIRETVGKMRFGETSLTISIGVSSFPTDAIGPVELFDGAIAAQRLAKNGGKNQSCLMPGVTDTEFAHEREQFSYYHGHLDEITANLERDRSVSCLFVDLSHLRRIEREYGVNTHSEFFARAGELLADTRGSCLRREDQLYRTQDADGYLAFLAPPRATDGAAPLDLDSIASRVEHYLAECLSEDVGRLTSERVRVVVGYARVLSNPMARGERTVLKVIADARESARLMAMGKALRDKAVLQDLILREQLRPVYQPIVQLESGDIFGFEALTRGPKGTSLESPYALFGTADEVDLTFELDRACFRGGLRGAAGLSPVHRLFVNLLPHSFYDTRFIESAVEQLMVSAGLTPANVVFEITERLAIENFTAFRHALTTYTAMGFGVAIDDVGTRHSNLETVMALQPHFVKVSDVLTRGVSRSTVKREMLGSLQRIAEAIDAVIVAEGIEDAADLEVLCELGIRYGQGFYLARPGPAFPELKLDRQREIRQISSELRSEPHPNRTRKLEVVRLRDDEETAEHQGGRPLGRGSGEIKIPNEAQKPVPESSWENREGRTPSEDTKPQIVLPVQEPWRPLADEDFGTSSGESSLLDALRSAEDGDRKRSVN